MKKVAIIGANGMLGSDLVTYLQPYFSVYPITRDTYTSYSNKSFDIVINANGNSKRFWANKNILEDFNLSTTSVYKSILDFPADLYIYISTSDIYPNHKSPTYTKEDQYISTDQLSPYGLHKYLSEVLVKRHSKNYLILRSSMMLGSKLTKGPIYDILHKQPLFIANESKLQMITTKEIAQCLYFLTKEEVKDKTYNLGGKGAVSVENIRKVTKLPVSFSVNAEKQIYEMNISKLGKIYPLKTSLMYLQDFINSLQSQ